MKRNIIAILLLALPVIMMAESVELRDTETIQTGRVKMGTEFNFHPVSHFSIGITPEVYLRAFDIKNGVNNNNPFDRINVGVDFGYKTCKYFKVNAGYTFMSLFKDGNKKSGNKNYFAFKHRVDVDAIGYLHHQRWTFSLRERFRVTFRPDSQFINPAEKLFAEMEMHSRFKVAYKCFSKPLKPFLQIEMVNPLNQNKYVYDNLKTKDYWLKKMRYGIGLDWKLDGYSTLTFYYTFEHGTTYDVDLKSKGSRVVLTPEFQMTHILGVYYTFSY